jgi:ABC-type lipoprotein release transport system permease subunit
MTVKIHNMVIEWKRLVKRPKMSQCILGYSKAKETEVNRFNIIFLIIGISVTILIVVAVISATHQSNLASEKIKLIKGEISIFQYCSYIGKDAVNDTNCKEFDILYGPQPLRTN